MSTPRPGPDPHRLAAVQLVELARGQHTGPGDGACLMEAAAYLAGETWSDDPPCASPVIAGLLRTWNDLLPDRPRQELRRYLPRIVASRGTPAQETERAEVAAWWLTEGPGRVLRGRGRTLVEAAITEARHHAPGTPPAPLVPLPELPRRVSRQVLDAMHDLIDRLLTVTETPDAESPRVLRGPATVERRQRLSRPSRRARSTRRRSGRVSGPSTSSLTELPE